MTERELRALRGEIESIDRDIAELVARRQEVAAEIALVKSKNGLSIKDTSREKAVIRAYEQRARSLGMNPAVGRRIARLMISLSVAEQIRKRPKSMLGTKALVVGGGGRMGEWACRFLSTRGAEVDVFDSRRRPKGYRTLRVLPESVDEYDLIVIAGPLGACPGDLELVLSRNPKGLVFDVCSIKGHIASTLRKAASRRRLVTSVHPMFGPNAPSPMRRNVLICRCGSERADKLAQRLFSSEGANVSVLDIEDHDELMAYVLGLSHLCTLMFSHTLAMSGRPLGDLTKVQGPSFAKLTRMASDLLGESRRVYHDIQRLNPNTRRLVKTMEQVLKEVVEAALDSGPERFRRIMDSDGQYLEVS